MSKVDIISGFLGAGKTTLIKKLIKECFNNEKVVLIENEFGEIGIDGSFLKDAGIEITEMNSGCICCSLVGDFSEALQQVVNEFHPDRIIIEPSGVGKLSDVIKAVQDTHNDELQLHSYIDVIDAKKAKIYHKNFGEFFNNQIEHASTIILSRTQDVKQEKLEEALHIIKELNDQATVITTPWDELDGETIMNAIEKNALLSPDDICPVCGHHHEHHHHDDECECGHHHHEHHHHDGECDCGHHHEHHHHDGECGCGHHHHADEVFTSIGKETVKVFSVDELNHILNELSKEQYGFVLRAKGIVKGEDQQWIHFDFVPEEYEVRFGSADYTGRLCVIGKDLNEELIWELFGA